VRFFVALIIYALLQAAVAGLLIQHGADANAREGNMRRTPAHGAAERNYTEVIKLLLEASVDFNRTDRDGFTPLHLAAKANAADAVAILVKAPAVNVGQRMGTLSWVGGGWSAADLAKSAGHQQVAQLIAESIEARKRKPITY
jgi:ankyrin repeat protein